MNSSKPDVRSQRNIVRPLLLISLLSWAAVLATGCERPLPDTDKNPESGLGLPQQQSPNLPSHRQLPHPMRFSGPSTLVTLHEPFEPAKVATSGSSTSHSSS